MGFAALSGVLQLTLAVFPSFEALSAPMLVALLLTSLLYGVAKSLPPVRVNREFENPHFSVAVRIGDVFSEPESIVIGFTDVFDTSTDFGEVISPRSVQGQFLEICYQGDVARLDSELDAALDATHSTGVEGIGAKPKGKRVRYPIGTVAALRQGEFRYYCLAYSRMSNSLVARSSVDSLWRALNGLWESVEENGSRDRLAMPVIGGDLARVDSLDHETLVKMVILSFVARSRKSVISRELTIVIHPRNAGRVDMCEIEAFILAL
ncbi:macro domain-containing protein [Streptomyces sp. NPDC005283]|uniref:macro domain-containing protein n=1 Tax=Streptomyces sp. NPDC005283 TaxID=3156871 RepID=UPI00345461AE